MTQRTPPKNLKQRLTDSGVSIANFARYTGIHRITLSLWITKPSLEPRSLYLQKAEDALALMDKAAEMGYLPLQAGRRGNYSEFFRAMDLARRGVRKPAPAAPAQTVAA